MCYLQEENDPKQTNTSSTVCLNKLKIVNIFQMKSKKKKKKVNVRSKLGFLNYAHLHDQLVGSRDQCEAVGVVEGLRYVLTKSVACSSRRDAPAAAVVRVRPQQVAHGTLETEITG